MLKPIFFAILLQIGHCSCPKNFTLTYDGVCSRNENSVTSYNTVDNYSVEREIAHCEDEQAQPVSIHNDAQQSYWAYQNEYNNIFLGLVCNSNTTRWQWSDGSDLDYTPASYDAALHEECKQNCVWGVQYGGYWIMGCDKVYPMHFSFQLYCIINLPPLPIPSDDGCESFEDDHDDGVCYQVGEKAENWLSAQKICRNLGANLASIHNQQENSFVRRLAVSKGAVNGLFLGGTVSGKGNQFGWIDGSEWDYDNFYGGFPINGLGECLLMDTQGTSGQWMNMDCNSNYSVACVRQQRPESPPSCVSSPWNEGQLITSPGFPFDSSTPCDFLLTVDSGKRVKVEISLEANSCCDRLVIYDYLIGGNVVANLTGEISKRYYTTNANYMRVSWSGGLNVRGLMMQFWGV